MLRMQPLPLVLCAGALAAAAYTQQAVQPHPPPAPENQAKELDHFRSLANNYGGVDHYAQANAAMRPPAPGESPRILFFGDSITDFWKLDQFFPTKKYVNRGISGQTTPQMLVRYRQDVINLHPAVVVILAGTNDIANNTGPETLDQIEADLATFADLARAHAIKPVFSSVMPVSSYGPSGAAQVANHPPAKILELNAWLRQFCASNGIPYLDYYAAMVDGSGMLKRELSNDGLHPNAAGYMVMAPLAQQAIDAALAAPPLPPPLPGAR